MRMSKFHINAKGVPAPCKAQKGNCPFGGENSHYDTEEQAQQVADNQGIEKYGLLQDVGGKLDNLSKEIGVEKTLDGISISLLNKNLAAINERLIHDYDLDDFIDEDTEQAKFAQIRRFLGDESLLNDLSTRLSMSERENSVYFTEKLYSQEIQKDKNDEIQTRLAYLVNQSDPGFVVNKLESDLSNAKLREIKDLMIEDYDLDDFIDDDIKEIEQFHQIRRFLGDEIVLENMTTILTDNDLDKHIRNIEKYF